MEEGEEMSLLRGGERLTNGHLKQEKDGTEPTEEKRVRTPLSRRDKNAIALLIILCQSTALEICPNLQC